MIQILEEIVENKRAEIKLAKQNCPIESLREICEPATRDFRAALAGGREDQIPRLIAEIKRKSPSRDAIRQDLDVTELVKIYKTGAAAISILTDQKFFGGSLEDLDEANSATQIPLLRKDFIIDEYQLYEARQFGADAVLLIARILNIDEITNLILEAKQLGLDCLVEIHDEGDLKKALETPAEIIGVNSRNLDTLKIDLKKFELLLPKVPAAKIVVAESGIRERSDLEKLNSKNVDAVLVGTSLLQAKRIEGKLSELTNSNNED